MEVFCKPESYQLEIERADQHRQPPLKPEWLPACASQGPAFGPAPEPLMSNDFGYMQLVEKEGA
jgi:hypothetical protein